MKIKNLNNKTLLLIVLLVVLVMTSLIPFIRAMKNQPIIFGDKPYYDLRMTKLFLEKGFSTQDALIGGGRINIPGINHILSAPILSLLKDETSLVIFNILLGVLCMIIFYSILNKFKFKNTEKMFICVILALSTGFLYVFANYNQLSISILLILSGIRIYLNDTKKYLILSTIIFILASLINPFNTVTIVFILLFFSEIEQTKKPETNSVIGLIFLISFLYYARILHNIMFFSDIPSIEANIIRGIVSDLGAKVGLGIFTILLFFIGALYIRGNNYKLKHIYSLITILLLSGIYNQESFVYLSFFISIFAGYALNRFYSKKWDTEILKEFTMLLLVYGILFSSLSFINRYSNEQPSNDIKESLLFLGDESQQKDIVFSHYSRGNWIEYWAESNVLTDSVFNYPDVTLRLTDSDTILYSRNLDKTKLLLDEYGIKYLFIGKIMKEGLVWDEKEGLWYLLSNNETFKNIYSKNGVEIWEYLWVKDD